MKTNQLAISCCSLLIAATLAIVGVAWAQSVELNPNHPDRYTVTEGDTLWGISKRFLADPWRWPEIWKQNEQIKNPHLIYPGDVLVMTSVDGQPQLRLLRNTVQLSPSVRAEPLEDAIPTIPPNAIIPFLTDPLIIQEGELDTAGYVTEGVEDDIVLGKMSQFYARGIVSPDEFYRIFRLGEIFVHPETHEVLGQEAISLGDAKLLRAGDPAKMEIVRSRQEIGPTDRLVPAEKDIALPYYFPSAPNHDVEGLILSAPGGVIEVGPLSIVTVTLGERDGIEQGNILQIMRHRGAQIDPVTGEPYELPDERSGLLMIFRTFEKMSYALVLTATRAIHVLDIVRTP
ncbi:MAG: LysM peptidoglycan-binding domain-containing protein [Gammaproteobacteria bacterium]|nr:LysM peptidoglycan-binding domain-containing protein [Gammaproteobacteria bacterium]